MPYFSPEIVGGVLVTDAAYCATALGGSVSATVRFRSISLVALSAAFGIQSVEHPHTNPVLAVHPPSMLALS